GWRASLAGGILITSLMGVIATRSDLSTLGAYAAFISAIGVWGWIEFTFLTGLVTGPRTAPCPPDADGWRRFALAAQTLIYHEILILAALCAILAVTWGGANPIAPMTFAALALMRLSAKLNLFLGAPNFTDDLMPTRLRYLRSYFSPARASLLLPAGVLAMAASAGVLAAEGMSTGQPDARQTGFLLLAGLIGLGALEHVFMVLPVRDSVLWRWAKPKAAVQER
ncbi:MAG: putative photosynthetic complex assembly protein PuhE, partial [Pseudomonadota bacterium]